MYVICHHIDNDGYLGGAIIMQRLFGSGIPHDKIKTVPVNYGFNFNFIDELRAADEVYIVDFSFQPDVMKKIIDKVGINYITWIDHHDSAIRKYDDSDIDVKMLKGLRSREASGCELAYMYFYDILDVKDVDGREVDIAVSDKRYSGEIPYAVTLIGDWDTWKFRFEEDTTLFNAGLKIMKSNDLRFWFTFLDPYAGGGMYPDPATRDIMEQGRNILTYEKNLYSRFCKQATRFTDKKGRKWVLLNSIIKSSKVFAPIDGEKEFDVMCVFNRCDTYWTYSLYSKKIDVREISVDGYHAEGHPGAAGFQTETCIFNTTKIEEVIAKID